LRGAGLIEAHCSGFGEADTGLIAIGELDASRLKIIPLYPLREPAVRMVAGWYQFLDAIGQ